MSNKLKLKPSDIDIKPFKPKNRLNPDFFDADGSMKSRIRLGLLDIADDFVRMLEVKWVKPKDIVVTGSIANYNWSKFSDVDIHIIYDFSKIYKKNEFVKDYFDAKKKCWNDSHQELTIKGFPVEISVEDTKSPAKSSGVYSLEKNKWVEEPQELDESGLDTDKIKKFCAKKMTEMDSIFSKMDKEKDRQKLEKLTKKLESVYDELKNLRKEGLASNEMEMSEGNIIWKVIKHAGYIDKCWDYYDKVYDRRNTIDEAVSAKDRTVLINESQMRLIEDILNENATERKRQETAHNATLQVVRNFFHNADWLDREFVHQDNPNHMTSLDYMVFHFEEDYFHSPRPSKPIIRLEPMVAQLAFSFGFQQQNPNPQKLNELTAVVAYIEKMAKLGKLEIPKVAQMSPEQMFETFGEAVRQEVEAMRAEVENAEYGSINQDYEILSDVDYATAHKIGNLSCPISKLCYTQSESTWNSYTANGYNTAYVLLKKNYKSVPAEHNGVNEYDWLPENGYDEYGLSMIFVFVDGKGNITTSNTRWNHAADYGRDKRIDYALNEKDISGIIGTDFFKVFKGNDRFQQDVNERLARLRNGEDPRTLFDWYGPADDTGDRAIKVFDKYNILRDDKTLFSPDVWFDWCRKLKSGFIYVCIDDRYNFMRQDKTFVWNKPPEKWFDDAYDFYEGCAKVRIGEKYNFLRKNGTLVWDKPVEEWFSDCEEFFDGLAMVEYDYDKHNYLRTDGTLVWDKKPEQWFDGLYDFREGIAVVDIDNKFNFIRQNGTLIWNHPLRLWFDNCYCFNREGVARVSISNKWNFIRSDGTLVWNKPPNEWLDDVCDFDDGLAQVRIGVRWKYMDTNGVIYDQRPLNENIEKQNISSKPAAYLMIGMPGAGKSTWVKNNLPDLPVVSRDIIRGYDEVGVSNGVDDKKVGSKDQETLVTNIERMEIKELCEKGEDFVVDDTNTGKYRKGMVDYIRSCGARVVGIYVETDAETCKSRRDGVISGDAIDRMFGRMIKPDASEFDDFKVVSGNNRTVVISESQKLLIESLDEAAWPDFNPHEIEKMPYFAQRVKWCKKNLGPCFGQGSARMIFEIDDDRVLKLAKNQKGIAQNEVEVETSRFSDCVVKCFEWADDYSWVIEENCIPARKSDFKRLLSVDFDTFCDLLIYQHSMYSNRRFWYSKLKNNDEAQELVNRLYDEDEYGFVLQVMELMANYNLPFGDLTRISSYGLVKRDGVPEIVVIDSGLTNDVYEIYYMHKR